MRACRAVRIVADRLHFEVDARKIGEHLGEPRDRRDGQIRREDDRAVRLVARDRIRSSDT